MATCVMPTPTRLRFEFARPPTMSRWRAPCVLSALDWPPHRRAAAARRCGGQSSAESTQGARQRLIVGGRANSNRSRVGVGMTQVAIIGVGQTDYRRSHPDKSSRDLIWEASKLALEDARMEIGDMDVILTGVAPDALAGEGSVERTAMMGTGQPFLRVNTGGVTGSSTAFAGITWIRSGRAQRALVVCVERMGQASTSQSVFNTIFDPVYEKDFPLTTITMAALRAFFLMRLYGSTSRHWAEIAARSFRNARRNPHAHLKLDLTPEDVLASPLLSWPIHRAEACPMSEDRQS